MRMDKEGESNEEKAAMDQIFFRTGREGLEENLKISECSVVKQSLDGSLDGGQS